MLMRLIMLQSRQGKNLIYLPVDEMLRIQNTFRWKSITVTWKKGKEKGEKRSNKEQSFYVLGLGHHLWLSVHERNMHVCITAAAMIQLSTTLKLETSTLDNALIG